MLIVLLVLAACSTDKGGIGQDVAVKSPIKLGVILPLTGEAASWGQNSLAGLTLAVKEINAKGGIDGRRINLIVEDDKCGPDSVKAVQKLINVNQVVGLLGPVCSAAAGPAMPIAQSNSVPVVMIGASAPDLTSIGDYIFRVYPSDAFQGKEGAHLMFDRLKKRKVALLYVKNDWGEGIKKVFKEEFEDLGGEVVYESGVLATDKDFRTQIEKIKASEADALYLPLYPAGGVAALKQVKEAGLDLTVVGGDAFAGEEFVKSGYVDGTIFTVAKVDEPESFKAKINALKDFKDLEVNLVAPIAYDAANVMFIAIEEAGTDKAAIMGALKKTSHAGVSNPSIVFDAVGDLKNVAFDTKVVRNDKAVDY